MIYCNLLTIYNYSTEISKYANDLKQKSLDELLDSVRIFSKIIQKFTQSIDPIRGITINNINNLLITVFHGTNDIFGLFHYLIEIVHRSNKKETTIDEIQKILIVCCAIQENTIKFFNSTTNEDQAITANSRQFIFLLQYFFKIINALLVILRIKILQSLEFIKNTKIEKSAETIDLSQIYDNAKEYFSYLPSHQNKFYKGDTIELIFSFEYTSVEGLENIVYLDFFQYFRFIQQQKVFTAEQKNCLIEIYKDQFNKQTKKLLIVEECAQKIKPNEDDKNKLISAYNTQLKEFEIEKSQKRPKKKLVKQHKQQAH
jgi:hypothetical protein